MKWKVALVDDEEIQIKLLKKLLDEYAKENHFLFQYSTFTSAEAFLFHFEENKDFDLLMLDIEMDVMNGMELAHSLREENHDIRLLFVTGYTEYIAQGYEVSAIDYIVKPVNKKKLFKAMDRFQSLASKKEGYMMIETSAGVERVILNDIFFLEAYGHRTIINLEKHQIEVSESLGSFVEKIPAEQFIKSHRSYLINLLHVKQVTKKELIMDGNAAVPLSRRKYKTVNQAFIEYFKKEMKM